MFLSEVAIGVQERGDQAFGGYLPFDSFVACVSVADQDLLLVLDGEPKVFFKRGRLLMDGGRGAGEGMGFFELSEGIDLLLFGFMKEE